LDAVEHDATFEADRLGDGDVVADHGVDQLDALGEVAVFSGEEVFFRLGEDVGRAVDEVVDNGEVDVPFDDG